jgi:hypothetical protein
MAFTGAAIFPVIATTFLFIRVVILIRAVVVFALALALCHIAGNADPGDKP